MSKSNLWLAFLSIVWSLFGGRLGYGVEQEMKPVGEAKLKFQEVETLITVPIKSAEKTDRPIGEFKTSVLRDFDASESLGKDALSMGYPSPGNSVTKKEYSWGTLYQWNTATRGAVFFSYVCQKGKTFCLKIGPYTLVWAEFDWANAKFDRL
jgi:hypothetical protein